VRPVSPHPTTFVFGNAGDVTQGLCMLGRSSTTKPHLQALKCIYFKGNLNKPIGGDKNKPKKTNVTKLKVRQAKPQKV
jgi:hypothetical protein